MIDCAYCEKPLVCERCGEYFTPPSPEDYANLSRADIPVACPECGDTLTCHWCKTPYDGLGDDAERSSGSAQVG